jgi:uncharacterized protein
MTGRDRDAAGRARNARPRDMLGRPPSRYQTGESVTSDEVLPPRQALQAAQELIDSGRPFHAHEVLEAVWKSSDPAERDLWQGLAQLAVGLTHALRGNARGASRLDGYPEAGPYDIDVAGLRRTATALADRISQAGTGDLDPISLRIRLRAS